MTDNKSAHISSEYDDKISDTIPFYNAFHQAAIDLVGALNEVPLAWLDTGCGTGKFCFEAHQKFPNTIFTLADPSYQMLEIAKEKLQNLEITFVQSGSQSLDFKVNTFDIITAIQCHHYLDRETRKEAIKNCFRMLKPNGIFITFENIAPSSEIGTEIGLRRWGNFQISHGKSPQETEGHLNRFNKEYFPITIFEHVNMLKAAGFDTVEILWASYMQAGFYAIRS